MTDQITAKLSQLHDAQERWWQLRSEAHKATQLANKAEDEAEAIKNEIAALIGKTTSPLAFRFHENSVAVLESSDGNALSITVAELKA